MHICEDGPQGPQARTGTTIPPASRSRRSASPGEPEDYGVNDDFQRPPTLNTFETGAAEAAAGGSEFAREYLEDKYGRQLAEQITTLAAQGYYNAAAKREPAHIPRPALDE